MKSTGLDAADIRIMTVDGAHDWSGDLVAEYEADEEALREWGHEHHTACAARGAGAGGQAPAILRTF